MTRRRTLDFDEELEELLEEFPELDLLDDVEEFQMDNEAWYHGDDAHAKWLDEQRKKEAARKKRKRKRKTRRR